MSQGLQALVQAAFESGSVLSGAIESFRPRGGQTEMAQAIARTIEDGGVLVVEAGTGVGKTFAYLVPALLAGERVLLSTASKALQDQLYGRDLPHLIAALGLPVRSALLKGRGSYLCPHRLLLAREDLSLDALSSRTLARIELWAQTTRTGDLAELPGLDERSAVIPLVTSTRDNCLGTSCPKFKACYVNQARREALAADVVVVNHHLFFADLAVRESGMAELLPTARTVIFDEAHQLNETGIQFLGQQLASAQWLDFARDVQACGLQQARGLADWQQIVSALERSARDWRLTAGRTYAGARLRWGGSAPEGIDPQAWADALRAMRVAVHAAQEALATVSEIAPDFVRLHERAELLRTRVEFFAGDCESGSVRWLDVTSQLRLVESPLDIADAVRERMLKPAAPGDDEPAALKSWIFTSATLGDDAQLRWFTEPCGLEAVEILQVHSPFDYAQQAAVYVPRDLPDPGDARHSVALAARVAQWAPSIGGRTLVLTTSLRALRAIGEALQQRWGEHGPLEVLVQGQQPKRQLMERFRQGCEHGQRGCVLVASASFWEGFDVPGDALQLVVIDKLPFPPPNDPLVEARSRRLTETGRSPFNDYSVPEAAVALKQGAGRLIRRESDRGVLVIGDTRLLSKGYGRRLLAALPPMRRLVSEAELEAVLQTLTRVSTTDPTAT
jgi:ATP-dependent DNA helicase DinG